MSNRKRKKLEKKKVERIENGEFELHFSEKAL